MCHTTPSRYFPGPPRGPHLALATKKTAGEQGEDLALNAQQVTGLSAERDMPVVRALAKGSL
ncbi:DUF808 family protein, partial [Pseudomonas syringae group genomosp. 7]|uniref:DUF808 family protein n=1 Tax=Pseudomonas syringae group genomosp. 7 TaxID=251699 RepID=UPI00376FF685